MKRPARSRAVVDEFPQSLYAQEAKEKIAELKKA
jgi:outer membrane protein assembly factor BamD (BamD/ComL family)